MLVRQKTEDRVALNAENHQMESQLSSVGTEFKENMAIIKETRSKLLNKVCGCIKLCWMYFIMYMHIPCPRTLIFGVTYLWRILEFG